MFDIFEMAPHYSGFVFKLHYNVSIYGAPRNYRFMIPLISVIIPVYNVEDYLLPCLNSIAAQTWSNLEVILVDDGSTDLSGTLCDEFCLKDSRFRVVHQPNAGPGPARNSGVAHSSGAYVMFVDGDDFLPPEAVETFYRHLVSGPYDWSMARFVRTDEVGNLLEPIRKGSEAVVVTGQEAIERLLLGSTNDKYTFSHVWGKLFRRTVVDRIKAEHYFSGEDIHFCFRVFLETRQAIYLDSRLYYWRHRPNSITRGNLEKEEIHSFRAFAALEKETQVGDSGVFRTLYLKKLYRRMVISRFRLMNSEYSHTFLGIARPLRAKTRKEYFRNNAISLLEKAALSLAWTFPHLGLVLFKWKGN